MKNFLPVLGLLAVLAFGGCAAWQRGQQAATTPAPSLGGQTPIESISHGENMWEAIGLILAGALGLGGAGAGVVAQQQRSKRKTLQTVPESKLKAAAADPTVAGRV